MTNRPKRRFEIRKAVRSSAPPIIGFMGESGTGKTYSALAIAIGLAGGDPSKVALIDTENGRGEIFASDPTIGGYMVVPFDPPFTSEAYTEAWKFAVEQGASVVVIDSMSHEWEGEGGVLDQADQHAKKNGRSIQNWTGPKMEHGQMVREMMRANVWLVACMRAKYKTRIVNNKPVKDDRVSPIQSEDLIFEMTASFALNNDHTLTTVKNGTADLRACFPGDGRRPVTIEDGKRLREWLTPKPVEPPKPADPLATLRAEVSAAANAAWKADQNMAAEEGASIFGSGVKVSEAVAACTDETKLREAKRRFDGVVAFCAKADGVAA